MSSVLVRWARTAATGHVLSEQSHQLARRTVAERMGVELVDVELHHRCEHCGDHDHGRPLVSVRGRPGPRVTLARGDGLVIVGVSERAVGIDVEAVHPVPDFGPALLGPGEPWAGDEALLQTWVRKEAILKATGHGLRVDPRRLEVTPPDAAPRLVSWSGPGRVHVRLLDLDLGPGLVGAVARLGRRSLRVEVEQVPVSAVG